MTSSRDHVPGCTGKSAYPGFSAANRVARRIRERGECAISAYRCRSCSKWHVGTQFDQAAHHKARDFKRRRAALKGV